LSEASDSFIVTKSGNRYILDQKMDQIEEEVNLLYFLELTASKLFASIALPK